MLRNDAQKLWETIRGELVKECGTDKAKLAMAEIFGLRQLALEALNGVNAQKRETAKKKFTR